MDVLLSQTVVTLQTINGTIVSDLLTLPAGCTRGQLSFPNFDAAGLSDPTKFLQVDVEFSADGVSWRHDCGSGQWQPDADNPQPPAPITTTVQPQFAGALVRFIVKSNGLKTDLLAEVFGT